MERNPTKRREPTGRRMPRPLPWLAPAILALGMAAALATALIAHRHSLEAETAVLVQQAREIALLQSESLTGTLEKYRLIPPLLSKSPEVTSIFSGNPGAIDADELAARIAAYSGARDLLFTDDAGVVIGSNRAANRGMALGNRRWFSEAMQGRLGRQFVFDDARTPSYIFAFAVRDGARAVGVMAIDVWLDKIEATWSLARDPIIVTDRFGTILLGNRPQWRGRAFSNSPASVFSQTPDGEALVTEGDIAGSAAYVRVSEDLPLLGWQLIVMLDRAPALTNARFAASVSALSMMLLAAVGYLLARRMETRQRQARRDRANAIRLERAVRDRTAALKQAQADLVQSAKLAAIGQMAATLSHEYNQPLGALQAQAGNVERWLERGDLAGVRKGLAHITALIGRMSELSRALRGFARKPGTDLAVVRLADVMAEVLVIIGPRARNEGADVISRIDDALMVVAGKVRLSQVLVNLVANALDAMAGAQTHDRRVMVSAATEGDQVVLVVADNGPGMDRATRERVFDPFFTTKPQGQGLGLGLAIVASIIQDLGGRIRVEPNEPDGTRFVITLAAAQTAGKPMAAE